MTAGGVTGTLAVALMAALLPSDVVAVSALLAFALLAAALATGVHAALSALGRPALLAFSCFRRALPVGIVLRAALGLLTALTAPLLLERIVHEFLLPARKIIELVELLHHLLRALLLRAQPELWQPIDVLVWGKMLAQNLARSWITEALRAQIVAAVGLERAAALEPDASAPGARRPPTIRSPAPTSARPATRPASATSGPFARTWSALGPGRMTCFQRRMPAPDAR